MNKISDATTVTHPPAIHLTIPNGKPVIIGVYGLAGSGKTSLLKCLKQELGEDEFAFYDGSEVIANVVPGGLDAFHESDEFQKEICRKAAIDKIKRECLENKKVGVVAAHYAFWPQEDEAAHVVCTKNDLDTFTHILYMDVAAEIVAHRRENDQDRTRPAMSISHLSRWQTFEKIALQSLCRENGVLFTLISSPQLPVFSIISSPRLPALSDQVRRLLQDFKQHNEEYNLSQAQIKLDQIVSCEIRRETFLVMDADRTLAPVDTGKLFWEKVSTKDDDPLKALFSGPLHYSYTAFRQAVLLYEETADDEKFEIFCQDVAAEVTMHPEFVSLLRRVAEKEHVGAIIITCGLRRIWEIVIARQGLSGTVRVLGGGRISDGFVVTAAVKAALVARLQNVHHAYVWAFGDSPLDMGMLRQADSAVVVTGEESQRSKTMDAALTVAAGDNFQAHQTLMPSEAAPRLNTNLLPLIDLADSEVLASLLRRQLQVHHATERNAAKLLMTPMRDASISGPALRETHRRVGWYLATEFLADMIGVEEYPVRHVQGHDAVGYRLLHEQKTSIVALMRGGEPMALGVGDALPLAMFIHANSPKDVKLHHLQGQSTVVLVDSVVNSGKSVEEFVHAIRKLHATIHIIITAGVVQEESVLGGRLETLGRGGNIGLVALRLSSNKFTGSGGTDTGNRLFNTTHLA